MVEKLKALLPWDVKDQVAKFKKSSYLKSNHVVSLALTLNIPSYPS